MTFNEERNLPECLASVAEHVDQLIIVDCFSNDATVAIAREHTEFVFQNAWVNHSKQFQWALANTPIRNEWVLRLDADERWTKAGFEALGDILEHDRADGVHVRMKIYFMDRWMRFGGFYPNQFLRVFKRSKGTIEDRWMDEHIRVNGRTLTTSIDVIEANYDRQRSLVLWTDKHNGYSTREAVQFLVQKHKLGSVDTIARFFGNKTERKRWLKEKLYFRFPLFVRPFFYFVYRYVFQLGFLDGRAGFIFHTLHAFWYRFLVDAKICQIETNARRDGASIADTVKRYYGIEL